MILTAKDIAEITRLLDESHFSELKLEIGDFRLRVSRGGGGKRIEPADRNDAAAAMPSVSAPPSPAPPGSASRAADAPKVGEVDVPAPLLGNFYHAPRPGDPPFVKAGDRVTPDTVIGIIEVMKLMNSVRAGASGIVIDHLARNGSSVEEGQPLIRLKTEG